MLFQIMINCIVVLTITDLDGDMILILISFGLY